MISFSIQAKCGFPPEQICREFFEANTWNSFKGYGPVPGVRKASKASPQETEVGTIFSVENTDGSTHQEVVEEYVPGKRIVIKLYDFSPPLRGLATHIVERWEFDGTGLECRLTRTFELYPRNRFAALPLWILSRLLKKAVMNHTAMMSQPNKV